MRRVEVRSVKGETTEEAAERLVALLATGLERLLLRPESAPGVDFVANVSVTTDCPGSGREGEA